MVDRRLSALVFSLIISALPAEEVTPPSDPDESWKMYAVPMKPSIKRKTAGTHPDHPDSWMPDASDVYWNELSGASQNTNRPRTIDQINQLELDRNTKERKTLWGLVESITHAKNVKCMKAFSHVRFCRCLGEQLPVALSFEGYIAIVTGTKVQVNYPDMTGEEMRNLVNITIKAREQCVASVVDRD